MAGTHRTGQAQQKHKILKRTLKKNEKKQKVEKYSRKKQHRNTLETQALYNEYYEKTRTQGTLQTPAKPAT